MNYQECIEKSNQSINAFKETRNKRPKELKDTPEVRGYCIEEMQAHLEMIIDVKNVLSHRDMTKDCEFNFAVQREDIIKLKNNIKVLKDKMNSLDFNTFLDGVEVTDLGLTKTSCELKNIIKQTS